ncbi:MAG TPA: OmpA family protein [Bryobacteraceae bacterium]|nr:OmpA family protein [Bryobacteraceae bacterium]
MRRKPKYLESDHSTRERWLISYTDIVTILLILFVAVAAQGMKARVTPPPQPAPPSPIENPRQSLILLGERLKQRGIDLRMEARGLVISLPQVILFASGEDHVNPASLPLLTEIAGELRAIPNKIALVGHADTVPIHNNRFHNNWELSAARSLNLLTLFSGQFAIPESRLSIQSYGSNSPRNDNDTADGRAENRRVEMLILAETAQ